MNMKYEVATSLTVYRVYRCVCIICMDIYVRRVCTCTPTVVLPNLYFEASRKTTDMIFNVVEISLT